MYMICNVMYGQAEQLHSELTADQKHFDNWDKSTVKKI